MTHTYLAAHQANWYDRALTSPKTYEWNHSLGEIVTALIESGMHIDFREAHDSVPWEALPGQMTLRPEGGLA